MDYEQVQLKNNNNSPLMPITTVSEVKMDSGDSLNNYLLNNVKFQEIGEGTAEKLSKNILYKDDTYSELNTNDKDVIGAINEVNRKFNVSRTSGYLRPSINGVSNWRTSFVDLPLSRAYNCNAIVNITATTQPTITHYWDGTKVITGGSLLAMKIGSTTSDGYSTATISNGQIVWSTGLTAGLYFITGTLIY